MAKSLDKSSLSSKADDVVIAARNAKSRNCVRWYLMIYPYGRKGLTIGLDREVERRRKSGEPLIEYFAPRYVEAKQVDGKIVNTDRPLFENYIFVHASIKEIFRMKQFEECYNLPRRAYHSNGEQYYPYVSDDTIRDLKWIARSYSGVIPVLVDNTTWLVKGDRIRITSGSFKGVEATIFDNKLNSSREIMVVVDNWMNVPLLHVREDQYVVIGLNDDSDRNDVKIDDELLPRLHNILCRKYQGTTAAEDCDFVSEVLVQYAGGDVQSNVMRCKLYSILLMAYTILQDKDKRDKLMGIIHVMLPAVTAVQSKALLLTAMYGCTDNSLYFRQAHHLIDPWAKEASPKKSKQQLIQRLADYDRCLGH